MRKRVLGPGAPAVGVVGYGAWPLSDGIRPSEDDAIRVIHVALDGGATLIDTADAYCLHQGEAGHNERLVAKALLSWPGPREEIVVSTKGGFARPDGGWVAAGRPEQLRRACEHSLSALRVERIDLYHLHGLDPDVPLAESVGMLEELRREGRIRWIGISNVTVAHVEEARRHAEITTVQNRLNPFFGESPHDGTVAYCDAHGLGFLAYSPVGGGRLNRKLPDIEALAPIARRHGVSHHGVVLAWVLAQGRCVIAIPAARRVEHVADSQTAAALELSAEEIETIDRTEFSVA